MFAGITQPHNAVISGAPSASSNPSVVSFGARALSNVQPRLGFLMLQAAPSQPTVALLVTPGGCDIMRVWERRRPLQTLLHVI